MRKLCPFGLISRLILFVFALAALLASGTAVSAQVLRDARPYGAHAPFKVHQHPAPKVRPLYKTSGSTTTLAEYGTSNLVADIGPSAEDKVRMDGQTQPLLIVLTNISAETTINFSSIVSDTPAAFTVTSTCTSLQPGQTCNISATYLPQALCDGSTANIIISDDDPEADNNPYVEDPPGTVTISLLGYGSDSGMTLDDLTDSKLSATALAQELVGQGVTVSNVTYTGANRAAGTFTSTSNIFGFNNGIVLSTGGVRNVIGPNCDSGVTIENYYPGDTDLNTLLNQGTDNDNVTNDAAVLEFDFIPTSSTVSFQYVFSSDEYSEFVFDFNDVFGFFLNGNNIALIPGTQTPVSINTVNNGNSTGTPDNPPVNPQDFVNNDVQYANGTAPYDTEMDGFTVVFSATAAVTPNTTNHIKLAIADAIDYDVDSNVFIKAGSFSSTDLTLTPTSQDFGSVAVGSSGDPVTFTLTNIGTAAIDLNSIAASTGFTETNNCGDGLNPAGNDGSSCTIQVSFAPTTSGAATGTLTVNYTAVGSENALTVASSLSGTGTGGGTITVSPTSLSFGSQVVSTTSSAQIITITNTGTTAVTVSSVTVPGAYAQTNNCTSIAASGTCTINVTFTPTAAQSYTGNITITDSAAGSPHLVAVSGTGVTSQVIISIPSGGSNTATSVPGGTAYFGLLIAPAPGFSGTVQLSCTTSSPTVSCTPIPSTVTLVAGSPIEVAFGIQTYCKGTTTNNNGSIPALPTLPGGTAGIALGIVALALSGASFAYRRNPRAAVALALVLIVILVGAACSGGPAKGPNGITPAGTYYITLNATTAGGTTVLTNYLTLVVN